MKCNRVNLNLTFSAALVGLLLGLAPSAAYGHGNNPRVTPNTSPNAPHGPPWLATPRSDDTEPPGAPGAPGGGAGLGPAAFDALTTIPQVILPVGVGVAVSDVVDVTLQVLLDAGTVVPDFHAADAADAIDAVAPEIIADAFGIVHGSGSPGGVALNAIPAPGTLALLGLAAAAARRRRRRT